jgi:hypothetical protein
MVIATKPGHFVNTQFAKKMFQNNQNRTAKCKFKRTIFTPRAIDGYLHKIMSILPQ